MNTLENGIPLLYFKCKTPAAAIWFTKCGDCLDSYFGPSGLSHMLEHIYVVSDDNYYTNGATFSSSVSFIAINNKKVKQLTNLYEFLNGWFFKDNKLIDLIADHNIEDRIQELNRETGLKSLQYGKTVSVAESLKSNQVTIFSKFDESYTSDDIKQALYRMLDYMLDPSRIVIAIAGPKDTRAEAAKVFNSSFGQLKESKITINTTQNHISTFFKDSSRDDVFFFNFMERESIESSIIMPVSDKSFFHDHMSALYGFGTNNDQIAAVNTLFDIIDNSYRFFLEIRVIHRTTEDQLNYRDNFPKFLAASKSDYRPTVKKTLSLDDFIMITPMYSTGVIASPDMSIPEQSFFIFLVNNPDRSNQFLTKKRIPIHESKDTFISQSPFLERQQRFDKSCFLSLRKDLEETINSRKSYYQLFFPMSYESVLAAILLQTLYPRSIYLEKNMIMTPSREVYSYLANGLQLVSDDIDRSLVPSFLINLRTFCILEPVIDYSVALMNLFYGPRILNLQTSYGAIYYKTPTQVLDNDLFIFNDPFDFFVHVVKGDPGSYTNIIRKLYKKTGLIYHGEMLYYDNYTIIRGIMN